MCYGQILEHGLRKVRKARSCPVCSKPILPGQQAVFTKGVSSDGFESWYRHVACEAKLEIVDAFSEEQCLIDVRTPAVEGARDMGWKEFRRRVRERAAKLLIHLAPGGSLRT